MAVAAFIESVAVSGSSQSIGYDFAGSVTIQNAGQAAVYVSPNQPVDWTSAYALGTGQAVTVPAFDTGSQLYVSTCVSGFTSTVVIVSSKEV